MKALTLRLDKELNNKITEKANEIGVSKNTLIILILKRYLQRFNLK